MTDLQIYVQHDCLDMHDLYTQNELYTQNTTEIFNEVAITAHHHNLSITTMGFIFLKSEFR